jgi:outer membrane receptor for ferric coprogen and ferric-rhodotorulic acid
MSLQSKQAVRHVQSATQTRFKLAPLTLMVQVAILTLAGVAYLPESAQAQTVPAQAVAKAYQVPAGSLSEVLGKFAAQAGVALSFDPALVAGLHSQGLQGSYSVQAGFATLLTAAGFEAVKHSDAEYTLKKIPVSGLENEKALPTINVAAANAAGVTTEGTGSYAARGTTMFKGAQSLKDIPQSVSVVTRQLMDDRNAMSVYDALSSAPGITIQQSPQGGQYIYSRGFQLGTVQYDSVPLIRDLYGRANNYLSAMSYIDRVEILRGAAGLLQGEGSPAGAVNLVRKRPLSHNAFTAEVNAGSWDRYGVQVDVSRVLNEEGTLRGRIVANYQDQHSFIDYVNQRSTTLYGTLEYDISPSTSVNIGVSSEEVRGRPTLNGLPSYNTGADLKLPRSTYWGATWNRQKSTNQGLYADFSHQFNERWKFKISAAHIQEDHNFKFAGINGAVNPALMRSANIVTRQITDVETSGIDANLTGTFDALGRQHEIVTGANYAKAKTNHTFAYKLNYNIFNIDSFSPHIVEPSDAEIDASFREDGSGQTTQYGLYSVLRWQLVDSLKLVLGGRMSWFDTDWTTITAGPRVSIASRNESAKLTPYAGLIYEINPQWSAYVSYADIFQPQNSRNEAGDVLKPIIGANYEAGIKGELLDGKVNTAIAVFRIDQKHRSQVDFSTSPTCRNNYYCYTDAGEVRSQGIDAEISGEIVKDWSVFASYTYTRTKYLKDVTNEGAVFSPDTPKHLLRLWTTYRLPGALNKLTVGGGVDAQSDTYRQVGTIRADINGRAIWNALVKYDINRHWVAALNLNNVFDKRYYKAVAGFGNGSYYGDPRNVMLTVRGAF